MKGSRQKLILELIAENDIETQNQLIEALAKSGMKCTQATISRDIREMRLVKELSPKGVYRYAAATSESADHSERLRTIFRESVTSCAHAQNIVVIKTLPGLASAACSAIDRMEIRDLVGTIAGDDNGFLAMRDNAAAERFCEEIGEFLK
ncbi:MAG: arginine repressor [Oscillospiraceae bacterium]|nr:arginine repressor [Oscillospiraceae bacterium]